MSYDCFRNPSIYAATTTTEFPLVGTNAALTSSAVNLDTARDGGLGGTLKSNERHVLTFAVLSAAVGVTATIRDAAGGKVLAILRVDDGGGSTKWKGRVHGQVGQPMTIQFSAAVAGELTLEFGKIPTEV